MNTNSTTIDAFVSREKALQSDMDRLSLNTHAATNDNTEAPACPSAHPFRFLDLPTELRLIVYEAIDVETHHDTAVVRPYRAEEAFEIGRSYLTLATSLLATCRQIKSEAQPIFDKKLEQIKDQPVRFHMGALAAGQFVDQFSPLSACLGLSQFNADNKARKFHKLEADHLPKPLWDYINEDDRVGHIYSFERDRNAYEHWTNARDAEGCTSDTIPKEMRTLQLFTERSARAVSHGLQQPLSRSRKYDVELVLSEYITDAGEGFWLSMYLSEFHIDIGDRAREAGIAIVIKMDHGDKWRRDNAMWWFRKKSKRPALYMTDLDDSNEEQGEVREDEFIGMSGDDFEGSEEESDEESEEEMRFGGGFGNGLGSEDESEEESDE